MEGRLLKVRRLRGGVMGRGFGGRVKDHAGEEIVVNAPTARSPTATPIDRDRPRNCKNTWGEKEEKSKSKFWRRDVVGCDPIARTRGGKINGSCLECMTLLIVLLLISSFTLHTLVHSTFPPPIPSRYTYMMMYMHMHTNAQLPTTVYYRNTMYNIIINHCRKV